MGSDDVDIEIQTADGVAEAFVGVGPSGPGPGVLFFMDAFGLRPQVRQMVDRIASWGYSVVAPHVFYRAGSVASLRQPEDLRTPEGRSAAVSRALELIRGHTAEEAARDLPHFFDTLRTASEGDDVAVVGYCMGGVLALRAAAQCPNKVTRMAAFHPGRLVTEDPDSAHRVLHRIRGWVLLAYADGDPSMPPEAMDVVSKQLATSSASVTQHVYEGAPHGFTMADTSAYSAAAAERHYQDLRALLAR